MAALVVPGAPVSVLADHGLGEEITEKLMAAGITTVERLGDMTPEQLQEIPGFDPDMIERLQQAVMSYYGQFEMGAEAAAPEAAVESEVAVESGMAVGSDAPVESEAPVEGGVEQERENQSVTIENGEPSESR